MSAQYNERFSPPPYLARRKIRKPRADYAVYVEKTDNPLSYEQWCLIGRPRKPVEVKLHVYTIRLNEEEHAKLHALGGRKWVQQQLAKVKP